MKFSDESQETSFFRNESAALEIVPRINDALFLTGATASGKTKLGVELAKKWNAEILSLDSMAIYRKMDIGTAKPTLEEREGVPHYLIDIVDPSDEFSLAEYVRLAVATANEIRSRGRIPLFVGGTPLYLKGLLRGVFIGPSADVALREELARLERENGVGFLHRRLQDCDPISAARLHPNDLRRVVRALEVFEKTGKPISTFQKQFDVPASSDSIRVWVLDWNRDELYERIDRRVDAMLEAGFLDEVRSLLAADKPLSKTASQAVGYRELIEYLDGELSFETAVDRIKQYSRNFAKRQGTWFRSLEECRFVSANAENLSRLPDLMNQDRFAGATK